MAATLATAPGKPKELLKIKEQEFLQNNIEAKDFTSYLYIYNIFNEEEMENVDSTMEYQDRNKLFLKILAQKGKDGYTVFRKGLAKRGHTVSNQIQHKLQESSIEPEHAIMNRANRELIDPKDECTILQNRNILIRKMEASKLTSYMVNKRVLDGHDMTAIDSLPQPLRNTEFLRIICCRGSTAFMWFVEGLRVKGYGRLADLLLGRPITSSIHNQTIEEISSDEDSSDLDQSSEEDAEGSESTKSEDSKEIINTDDQTTNNDSQNQSGINNKTAASSNGKNTVSSVKDTEEDVLEKSEQINNTSNDNDEQQKSLIATDDTKSVEGGPTNTNVAQNKDVDINSDHTSTENKSSEDISNGVEETPVTTDRQSSRIDTEMSDTIQTDSKTIAAVDIDAANAVIGDAQDATPRSPYQKVFNRKIIREPIDFELAEQLKYNVIFLEKTLDTTTVASSFLQTGIIDNRDMETIQSLRDNQQQVRELVSLILWGGPTAFVLFQDQLNQLNQSLQVVPSSTQTLNQVDIPCIVIDKITDSQVGETLDHALTPQIAHTVTSKKHKFKL